MLRAFGITDKGHVRPTNEDCFAVDEALGLCVVADGMGGHNAGEVASRMAVDALASFIRKTAEDDEEMTWPFGYDGDLSLPANRLKTAIRLANGSVFRAADNREDLSGMGTTLVAALIRGDRLILGSAGDSRCYLLRGGELRQLTRDDSWVSAAWAEGILTADEIERHPFRNVITKAVGAKDSLEVDIHEHTLEPGDIALICSDGLHAMIHDADILRLLTPPPGSLQEAAQSLIDAANEAGGRDNVSVVLVRYTE